MTFVSAAAPLARYAQGDSEGAAALAATVLADDPNAADAYLALALIRLRAGETGPMVDSLRHCVRIRSADWLLARLRDDFQRRGIPVLPRQHALRLGAFLRAALSPLGPPLPPEQRKAVHPFVNVVGTSYVRSFGGNTAFFPLFIGMGPTSLLLTEEAASTTRRKFAANLRRVDASRDTLLVVGGDAFYHYRNLLKTRADPDALEPSPADFALMTRVAERHAAMFADARKQLRGRVFMLGSTPTFSPFVDAMALQLNADLQPICAAHDIDFIDPWQALADPATGLLRPDYSANAYPGDIHYSLATAPIFLDAMKAVGALPDEVPSTADFEWSSVFDCSVDPSEPTRIWSEPSVSPNNAFKSHKIAATHVAAQVADLLCFFGAIDHGRTFAMVNIRDGGPVVLVAPQLQSGCVALTDCEPNLRAARMALDFYGRSDVRLDILTPGALAGLADHQFAGLVLWVNPGSEVEDERRCNEALARLRAARVFVVTPAPERLAALNLQGRTMHGPFALGNRHLLPDWQTVCLYMSA